jgi:hypothetical protein
MEDGTAIPADATLTGALTVKASWTINTYTITYKDGETSVETVEYTVKTASEITL